MTTYRCTGSVCGDCGHAHRTLDGAARCLARHQRVCERAGGYSDRCIIDSDGMGYEYHDESGGYLSSADLDDLRDDDEARARAYREERSRWGY